MAAIRIRVYVANPSNREIRVSGGPPFSFTSDPAESKGIWGSFRIANSMSPLNAGPNTDWWGQPVYVFPPRRAEYNEAEIALREWAAGGWALAPGRYRVRAWFNGREGESADFTLTP